MKNTAKDTAKDTGVAKLATFRVYFRMSGDESAETCDLYIDACSAQHAVNMICEDNPDAVIIDVSKIITGWKQPKKEGV